MAEADTAPTLVTERFALRPLTPQDATGRYLGWLADADARRYIQAARGQCSLDGLRAYIAERVGRRDVLFLGIFEQAGGGHVGNIKYEPIDEAGGCAEMGILIGDPGWRGRGVAREVIAASARWLRKHRGILRVCLGVERDNPLALAAYRRAGFKQTGVTRDPRVTGDVIRMTLETGR
ncbi:MAG: GNAT family N-acetyltransferase [Burkholderiales bacterium]